MDTIITNVSEKKYKGKKITVDVKNNPEYFNEWYHAHNDEIQCACGQSIKTRSLMKHKKTVKHSFLMAKKTTVLPEPMIIIGDFIET